MFERPVALRQLGLAAVLSDHEGTGGKRSTATSATEEIKRTGILRFGFVGRVDVNEIDKLRDFAEPLQHRSYTPILHGEASIDLQCRKILADRRQCRLCVFGKPHMGRATAQRLDSNRSRTGVEIDKATATDPRRQNIEEPFAQAVAGRTRLKTTWGKELTRAVSSSNDAHIWMV